MVTEYDMSEVLGPVSYADAGGDVFLGRDLATRKEYSESKAREIDEEVSSLLLQSYDEAKQLLAENRALLDRICEALLERETLDAQELLALRRGEVLPALPSPLPPPDAKNDTPSEQAQDSKPSEIPGDKLPEPVPS